MLELVNSALLASFEALLNGLIAQDPAARAGLRELAGKRFRVRSSRPELCLTCTVHGQGLLLSSRDDSEVDVELRGSVAALLDLLRRGDALHSFHGTGVQVEGDAAKARELQNILRGLRIDWEYALSRVLGDVPVHLTGEGLRGARSWLRGSGDSLLRDVDEYLHEEARVTPGKAEMEDFYAAIQALRLSVDRVAARVEELDRQLQPSPRPRAD